ncbi:polyprenyl synthetase family protein [Nakamurella sp. DB0629]|uniref:Polyprenyl synthetase family protein n=1 Tax=Nakamurella aerolata TaxID=1656892 RepID=A0A849A1Z4_9ACTN|nr:polyprenyl synthetase family protein [Nakamurella aerolata]
MVQAVDDELAGLLAHRRREWDQLTADSDADSPVDRIEAFLAGGKRIRPVFCWWGWRAGGGRRELAHCRPVLRAAAALELIQVCALVHDDVIDRSDTRRGRPAEHRAAAKIHADAGWAGDAEHYGLSSALLLGDLALAWADDTMVEAAQQLAALRRVQPVWRAMRTEVLAGQLLDLQVAAAPAADPLAQQRQAMTVIELKTAAYTVTRPLLLGAALAGAGPSVLGVLTRYGTAIGTAFQLRDDLLGVFGDPAQTGKPAGDDLAEGKRTVLLALALRELAESGRVADATVLGEGLGRASSAAGRAELTDIVASTGAAAAVESMIAERLAEAVAALEELPAGADDAAAALRTLAGRATARRS